MRKVLIVEDDFLIAEDYRMTVEEFGWQVLGPAASVDQALDLLQDSEPSVAILDLMLWRSLSTAVAIALLDRRIPFIVASACSNIVALGGEVFEGIVNVGKPVEPRDLVQALNTAVESGGSKH